MTSPIDPATGLVQPPELLDLCRRVHEALNGGRPLLPATWPDGADPGPDTALVVATSGSSGSPRWVSLTAGVLRASAAASAARLGASGRWLLALPTDHIAGLNVVVRALLAGALPTPTPPGPFTAEAFCQAARLLPDGPKFTSLVPTQLARIVGNEGPALGLLADFHTVLVGGAPADPALLDAARQAGVNLVETYGMTETAGGCVYDGIPLYGVRVRLAANGRIELSGSVLAQGYCQVAPNGPPDDDTRDGAVVGDDGDAQDRDGDGGSDQARLISSGGRSLAGSGESLADDEDRDFYFDTGRRWFRTPDLGRLNSAGRLRVIGRADDIIISGGQKVAPTPVEQLVRALDGVDDAIVVGLPDAEWGQAVTVLVVPTGSPDDAPPPGLIRQAVADRLGAAQAPKRFAIIETIPTRPSGKPDRAAARHLAEHQAQPIKDSSP